MTTLWRSYNSDEHNNSDKPVLLYITLRYQEADKVLFIMWGDQSLGYWSRKTSHYFSCRRNNDDESSEE